MKWRPLLLALLLAACSKATQENYQKIEEGMTEEQVAALLGKPTESSSTVRFVGGKVAVKSFDKPVQK